MQRERSADELEEVLCHASGGNRHHLRSAPIDNTYPDGSEPAVLERNPARFAEKLLAIPHPDNKRIDLA